MSKCLPENLIELSGMLACTQTYDEWERRLWHLAFAKPFEFARCRVGLSHFVIFVENVFDIFLFSLVTFILIVSFLCPVFFTLFVTFFYPFSTYFKLLGSFVAWKLNIYAGKSWKNPLIPVSHAPQMYSYSCQLPSLDEGGGGERATPVSKPSPIAKSRPPSVITATLCVSARQDSAAALLVQGFCRKKTEPLHGLLVKSL